VSIAIEKVIVGKNFNIQNQASWGLNSTSFHYPCRCDISSVLVSKSRVCVFFDKNL
jgi:hypothetical protein